jgi:16S rRNA (cytidine1402-2'-O)-methyltransferase
MRGSLAELAAYYTEHEPKGEIVMLVGGAPEPEKPEKRNKYKEVTSY